MDCPNILSASCATTRLQPLMTSKGTTPMPIQMFIIAKNGAQGVQIFSAQLLTRTPTPATMPRSNCNMPRHWQSSQNLMTSPLRKKLDKTEISSIEELLFYLQKLLQKVNFEAQREIGHRKATKSFAGKPVASEEKLKINGMNMEAIENATLDSDVELNLVLLRLCYPSSTLTDKYMHSGMRMMIHFTLKLIEEYQLLIVTSLGNSEDQAHVWRGCWLFEERRARDGPCSDLSIVEPPKFAAPNISWRAHMFYACDIEIQSIDNQLELLSLTLNIVGDYCGHCSDDDYRVLDYLSSNFEGHYQATQIAGEAITIPRFLGLFRRYILQRADAILPALNARTIIKVNQVEMYIREIMRLNGLSKQGKFWRGSYINPSRKLQKLQQKVNIETYVRTLIQARRSELLQEEETAFAAKQDIIRHGPENKFGVKSTGSSNLFGCYQKIFEFCKERAEQAKEGSLCVRKAGNNLKSASANLYTESYKHEYLLLLKAFDTTYKLSQIVNDLERTRTNLKVEDGPCKLCSFIQNIIDEVQSCMFPSSKDHKGSNEKGGNYHKRNGAAENELSLRQR